jgi:TonB family protein
MSSTSFHSEELPRSPERRHFARQRVRSLAYLDVGSDNGGIVLNLSENGLALQAVNPFIDQTRVTLRIQPPKSRKRIEANAEITWLSESKREAGLHFLALAEDARAELVDWVSAEAGADKPRPLENSASSQTRLAPSAPMAQESPRLRDKWSILLSDSIPGKTLGNQKEPSHLPNSSPGVKDLASQPRAAQPEKLLDIAANHPESPAPEIHPRTSDGADSAVSPPLSPERVPGVVADSTVELPPPLVTAAYRQPPRPTVADLVSKRNEIPDPTAPAMNSVAFPGSQERRRFTRQRARSLTYLDVGADNGGMVLNLSENGLALQAVNPFIDQTRVTLRIQPPKSRKRIEVSAEITWLSDSKREAGFHFLDLADDARAELADWVSAEAATGEPLLPDDSAGPQIPQVASTPITQEPPRLRGKWSILLDDSAPEKTLTNPRTLDPLPDLAMGSRNIASQPSVTPPGKFRQDPASRPDLPLAAIRSRTSDGVESTGRLPLSLEHTPDLAANPILELPLSPVAASSHQFSSPTAANLPGKSDEAPSPPISGISPIFRQLFRERFHKWRAIAALCTCTALIFLFLGMAIMRGLLHDRLGKWSGDESVRDAGAALSPPTAPAASSQGAAIPSKVSNAKTRHTDARGIPRTPRLENPDKYKSENPKPGPPDGATDSRVAQYSSPVEVPQQAATSETQNAGVPSMPALSVQPSGAPPAINPSEVASAERRTDCYLLYRVEPLYPREAKAKHIEGTVTLHLLIGVDGRVRSVRELDGPGPLVPAALSAAREWRFIPALLNGRPIDAEKDISIDFRLPH